MLEESARRPLWPLAWLCAALASIIALIGLAGLWWLAIPRTGGVCFAIYPAPPGCSDSRIPVAAGWSVGLVVLLDRECLGGAVPAPTEDRGVRVVFAGHGDRCRAGLPRGPVCL